MTLWKNGSSYWQKFLILKSDFKNKDSYTVSKLKLTNVEINTNIILPLEYKNFCRVFGTGIFKNIAIYYPDIKILHHSKKVIKLIERDIEEYPIKDKLQDLELVKWLNNLLVFAVDDRGNIAAWDLKSFKEKEDSYDIYWIQIELFKDEIYKVSSNFFDFVRNFYLARKKYLFLPEYIQPEYCDRFTTCKTTFEDI